MDTKSKSIKYSYGLKTIAVCFTLVFALLAGYFGSQLLKTLGMYGQNSFSSIAEELITPNLKITQSLAFKSQINTDMQTIATANEILLGEKNSLKNALTKDEEIDKALVSFENFKTTALKKAQNNYNAYQQEKGTSGKSVTTANGNYDKDYYNHYNETYSISISTQLSNTGVTFLTSMSTDDVKKAVSETYDNALAAINRTYEMNVTAAKREMEAFKNFKYYLVSKDGKNTFTNMSANVNNVQLAKEELSKNDFYIFYTCEKGLLDSKGLSNQEYYSLLSGNNNSRISISDAITHNFVNNGYDVYISVTTPFVDGDAYSAMSTSFNQSNASVSDYVFSLLLFLALAFMLSLYLILVTGRVRGVEGVKMSIVDKIPSEIHLILSAGIMIALALIAIDITDQLIYGMYSYPDASPSAGTVIVYGIAGLFSLFYAVLLEFVTSIARYIKAKRSWLRDTAAYRILIWCKKKLSKASNALIDFTKKIKYKPKNLQKKIFLYALIYLCANGFLFILLAMTFQSFGIFLIFSLLILCFNAAALLVIYKYLIALDKIIASSERDINEEMLPIDGIESMPEPLKTLAGNISVTQDEMKKAVDEAIKGEKMKTELITNVSHDLKTPLTSIISYVDLLKKCDIDDVSAQKYIDVLDEKSIRLKRLIEDLVEASKASSGAVTFNKMKVNLYELTIQAITEMDDMFEKNNLEVILEPTENPPMIFADSQKTWRIIDNLLSNSKKYSLEGTRVYVSLSSDENFGSITIKNTSRDALNINPDELTERFVRGDSSRTREGSGLGLSIAKDLCNLQGGKLDISIDGDLFKVTVNMPLYK
ncbi:MAG: HAMP domain-containing sensor histidine kinase [Oscillospiraceae bacterium]